MKVSLKLRASVATAPIYAGRKQESLDLRHYLPILERKGRAIRYARPVLNAVPAEFLNWMEKQHLNSKQMVELLEQCLTDGYLAVMQRDLPNPDTSIAKNDVPVLSVDLSQYRTLDRRRKCFHLDRCVLRLQFWVYGM